VNRQIDRLVEVLDACADAASIPRDSSWMFRENHLRPAPSRAQPLRYTSFGKNCSEEKSYEELGLVKPMSPSRASWLSGVAMAQREGDARVGGRKSHDWWPVRTVPSSGYDGEITEDQARFGATVCG